LPYFLLIERSRKQRSQVFCNAQFLGARHSRDKIGVDSWHVMQNHIRQGFYLGHVYYDVSQHHETEKPSESPMNKGLLFIQMLL
jgi:hypothetical protein